VGPTKDLQASRRLGIAAIAVLLTLGGCGGGDLTATTNNNQPATDAYAYVASAAADPAQAGTVYEYAVKSNGSQTWLSTIGQVSAGAYPAAVVMNQSNVWIVNTGDGTISQYGIGFGDTLAPLSPAAVANPGMHTLGQAQASATLDVGEGYLYVANAADNTVSVFSIFDNGALTPLPSLTIATAAHPVSIVPVSLAGGAGIYVLSSGDSGTPGSVTLYMEGNDGALTAAGSFPVAAGTNPSVMAINGTGSTVYVASDCNGADCTGAISEFSVGANGALTDMGVAASIGSDYQTASIVLPEPNGSSSFAYAVGNTQQAGNIAAALWQYEVGSTGGLSANNPPSLGIGSVTAAQAVYKDGLYVLTNDSGPGSPGSLDLYSQGSNGTAALEVSTKLDAPNPLALGILVLLPP
jgi:6-phosphogluconolactonase (cycloisomerase 2 family)